MYGDQENFRRRIQIATEHHCIGRYRKTNRQAIKDCLLSNNVAHIEFVAIGPRFSNIVVQTLLVLLKKLPPLVRKFHISYSLITIAFREGVYWFLVLQVRETFWIKWDSFRPLTTSFTSQT